MSADRADRSLFIWLKRGCRKSRLIVLIRLTLPDPPPSVNESTAVVNGRKIKSKEARVWFTAALYRLNSQPKLPGPCYWRCSILIPGKRTAADIGNLEKAVTDAIVQAGCAPDDRYLVDVRLRFHGGDDVKIAVKMEDAYYWGPIRGASKKLIAKLAKAQQQPNLKGLPL
jgi:Holliday junction resolvase RusA-like endonuclease